MPPNSSVTRAMCTPVSRNCSSTLRARMFSATKSGGCIIDSRSTGWFSTTAVRRVRMRIVPTQLSRVPRATGKREWVLSSTSLSESSRGSSRSSQAISVRGVIIDLIGRSPSRNTRCTISCSASSNTPDSVPWRIRALISSSVISGSSEALIPIKRNMPSVEPLRMCTSGAVRRESKRMGPATWQAMASGLPRAMRLGTSSPITRER